MTNLDTLARVARDVFVLVIVGASAMGCGKTKPHDSVDAAATADVAADVAHADRSADVAADVSHADRPADADATTDIADGNGRDADGGIACDPQTCASNQFCVRGTGGVPDSGVFTDCPDLSACDGGVPTCACISNVDASAASLSVTVLCEMGCQQMGPRQFWCQGI